LGVRGIVVVFSYARVTVTHRVRRRERGEKKGRRGSNRKEKKKVGARNSSREINRNMQFRRKDYFVIKEGGGER